MDFKKSMICILACSVLLTGCGSTNKTEAKPSSQAMQSNENISREGICTPQEIRAQLVKYAEGQVNNIHNNISSILLEYQDKEILCFGVVDLSPEAPPMPAQCIDDVKSFQAISEEEYPTYMQPFWFMITYKDESNDVRSAIYNNIADVPEKLFDIKGSCYDYYESTGLKSSVAYKKNGASYMLINYSDVEAQNSCVAMLKIDKSNNISVDWCATIPRVIFNREKPGAAKIAKEWTVYTDCKYKNGAVDFSNGTIYAEKISINPNSDNTEWDSRKNWLKLDYEINHNGETPSDEILESVMSIDVSKRHLYYSEDWKKENQLWKDLFNADVITRIDEVISMD